MAQSSFNRRVPQISVLRLLFCANPSELRALLTCVYHRTLSRWCNAWVRRLKASVAAKGGFLNSDLETSHRAAQRHSATHVIDTHLTLHVLSTDTGSTTDTDNTCSFPKWLKSAGNPFALLEKTNMCPGAHFFFETCRKCCRRHAFFRCAIFLRQGANSSHTHIKQFCIVGRCIVCFM